MKKIPISIFHPPEHLLMGPRPSMRPGDDSYQRFSYEINTQDEITKTLQTAFNSKNNIVHQAPNNLKNNLVRCEKMEQINLVKILHGNIKLIDEVNVLDIALFKMNVIIYPRDVQKILKRFLFGNISAEELNKWAEFISLRAEYNCLNWEIDEIADYHENMWDIIHRLSVPEIDGEINKERVKHYLTRLEKYEGDPYPIRVGLK